MVTCGTYLKRPHFRGAERLGLLCEALFNLAARRQWNLQAWAVFSNHYHFVAFSPADAGSLPAFLGELHSETAREVNRRDGTPGRRVWFQYWETRLTYQRSYLARLSYVHRNAVHHGLAPEAELYPWCSAGWFQRKAETAFYKTVTRFGVGRLRVPDDFEVDWTKAEV